MQESRDGRSDRLHCADAELTPRSQAITADPAAAPARRAAGRRRAAQPDRRRLPRARRPDPARAARPDRRARAALRLPPAGGASLQPVAHLQAPGDAAPRRAGDDPPRGNLGLLLGRAGALEIARDFIDQLERSLHTPHEADYCPPESVRVEDSAACPRARRRGDRHLRAGLRRRRRDHGQRQDRGARPGRHRAHLRSGDHGDDLRGRAHLRRPLQPGRQLRLRADAATSPGRASPPTGRRNSSARSRRRCCCAPRSATSRTSAPRCRPAPTASVPLGGRPHLLPDVRDHGRRDRHPRGRRSRRDRDRRHGRARRPVRRPDHRRVDEPGPLPRPCVRRRRARTRSGIYLFAPLLGAALGALAYQFVRGETTRPAEITTAPAGAREEAGA